MAFDGDAGNYDAVDIRAYTSAHQNHALGHNVPVLTVLPRTYQENDGTRYRIQVNRGAR